MPGADGLLHLSDGRREGSGHRGRHLDFAAQGEGRVHQGGEGEDRERLQAEARAGRDQAQDREERVREQGPHRTHARHQPEDNRTRENMRAGYRQRPS